MPFRRSEYRREDNTDIILRDLDYKVSTGSGQSPLAELISSSIFRVCRFVECMVKPKKGHSLAAFDALTW